MLFSCCDGAEGIGVGVDVCDADCSYEQLLVERICGKDVGSTTRIALYVDSVLLSHSAVIAVGMIVMELCRRMKLQHVIQGSSQHMLNI